MKAAKPNVLIVDDDIQSLECMNLYLEDIATVATVSSGRQAISYLHHNKVDVILLDLEMPILDGFKTLEQFRNMKECINVPIVLVTGRRDKGTVMSSIAMGVDGYLTKPVSRNDLRQKVQDVYQNKARNEHKKTILAIDDDMTFLKLINNYLSDTYNVIMINSSKLAVAYLTKRTPDLILLDYQMPLYNGVKIMNMLQKNLNCQDVPVIILSGSMDRDSLRECLSCNPAGFLAKPVTKEALLDKIEIVLNA